MPFGKSEILQKWHILNTPSETNKIAQTKNRAIQK